MIAEWVLTALLEATLAGSAAIVLVLALRRAIGARFGAAARYRSWLLVPAAMLAPLLPARTVVQAEPLLAADASLALVPAVQPAVVAAFAPDAGTWLLAAWLAGACVLALMLWHQQRRYVAAMRPDEPGRVVLHPGLPRWRRSALAGAPPALIGALRPWLLVPADFEQRYDSEERALVLAHEHRHLVRGDALANLLVAACRCLQWFNPLVHLAAARMRFDQELACDADVLRAHPNERRRYADAMLKTALAANALPLGCHWQATHPLEERIAMLRHPVLPRARALLGNALVVALLASVSLAAWAAQPPTVVEPGQPRGGDSQALASTAQDPAGPAESRVAEQGDPVETPVTFASFSAPQYPTAAKEARQEGVVIVQLRVDAEGMPHDIEVAREDLPGVFTDAAVTSVRDFRFNPAQRGGRAVEAWVEVPISFQLSDTPRPEPTESPPVDVAPETNERPLDAAFDWRFQLNLDGPKETAEC